MGGGQSTNSMPNFSSVIRMCMYYYDVSFIGLILTSQTAVESIIYTISQSEGTKLMCMYVVAR